MLRILHDTKYDFIRYWRKSAFIVAVCVLPAVVGILWKGFNYSVEFTGGTLMYVSFAQETGAADVRSALSDGGVAGAEIASFGSDAEYTIRARDEADVTAQADGAESIATRISAALEERFGAGSFTVDKTEAVGPKVGAELRQTSVIALLIAFGLTLVYLAWRFEWRFGVASVLATVHDIVVTFAFIFYAQLEISVFTIGAMLTVIGYSLNDTVVVFDRVRENLTLHRKMTLYDLLNRSVNETLPRTVMTGSTTLATLLSLLIFGGEVIRDFAAILIVGILVGTFSSIFVAGPLLLYIERRWPHDVGDRSAVGAPISKSALKGGPAKA
jgi:preprotein translocase subunit SecF